MEFFTSQESLTVVQWALRAIVAFFYLLLAAKIMGQRSISQLRLLDFMMALLIGNIIAHPLSDEQLGLKGSMITVATLVLLYILSVYISLKWNVFKYFLEPSPFPLIKNGKIIYKGLGKARISLEHLLSELRKEKVDDIKKVSLALWEPGGTISLFLESQYDTLTPSDMGLQTQQFSFPLPIIKEGKMDVHMLSQLGKDEKWLISKLSTVSSVDVKDILLATIDSKHNVQVYQYD